MAGVPIIARLERQGGANFALVEGADVLGAFITVADLTARDAIPTACLRTGAVVRIGGSSVYYEWNGAAWITFTGFGGSGGSVDWKDSVKVATTTALAASTRVSNTRTANANGAFPTIDAVSSFVVGDRILDKDHATGADRGIWAIVSLGSVSTPWVIARASDADADSDVTAGMRVPVAAGTANGGKIFKLDTLDPITVNTTALSFSVDSGGTSITAGDGLTGTTTLAVLAANSTIQVGAGGIKRTAITGDIIVPDASETAAIAPNVIVDADINSAAAIAWSKLAAAIGNLSFTGLKTLGYTEVDNGNSGSGTKNIDFSTGQIQKVTGNGNATASITLPTGAMGLQLKYVQDATGGRSFDVSGLSITWLDGVVWRPNPAANSITLLSLYTDGTNVFGFGRAFDSNVITVTGTSGTFAITDSGGYVRTTNGSPVTLTVPPNSSVAFPINTLITGIQAGAGQVSLAQGAGVTINKPASRNRKTAEQFSPWALKKIATDEWDLCGDLEFA